MVAHSPLSSAWPRSLANDVTSAADPRYRTASAAVPLSAVRACANRCAPRIATSATAPSARPAAGTDSRPATSATGGASNASVAERQRQERACAERRVTFAAASRDRAERECLPGECRRERGTVQRERGEVRDARHRDGVQRGPPLRAHVAREAPGDERARGGRRDRQVAAERDRVTGGERAGRRLGDRLPGAQQQVAAEPEAEQQLVAAASAARDDVAGDEREAGGRRGPGAREDGTVQDEAGGDVGQHDAEHEREHAHVTGDAGRACRESDGEVRARERDEPGIAQAGSHRAPPSRRGRERSR